MRNMKNMEKNVKEFILKEYESAKSEPDKKYVFAARNIAFGALQFAVNNCIDKENCQSLMDWWNDDMLDKFNELLRESR